MCSYVFLQCVIQLSIWYQNISFVYSQTRRSGEQELFNINQSSLLRCKLQCFLWKSRDMKRPTENVEPLFENRLIEHLHVTWSRLGVLSHIFAQVYSAGIWKSRRARPKVLDAFEVLCRHKKVSSEKVFNKQFNYKKNMSLNLFFKFCGQWAWKLVK